MRMQPQDERHDGRPGRGGTIPSKQITVLLAEDNKIVRKAFRNLLENEADLKVVGEAQNGRQAVKMTGSLRPAVVLMDIAMPLLDGLEATRQIREDFPDTKVLILSAHSDAAYVEKAIALGAVGFLLKQTSSHNVPGAIREAQKGNSYFSPSIGKPSASTIALGSGQIERAGSRRRATA